MPSYNKNSQRRSIDFGTSRFNSTFFLGRGLMRKNPSNGNFSSTFSENHSNNYRNSTPSMFSRIFEKRSKIAKKKIQNMNHVQANMYQKEQYRKLIDQHRSQQNDSEALFVIKNKKEEPVEVIDLDLHETIVTGNLSPKPGNTSFDLAAKTLERARQRIKMLQQQSKATNGLQNGDYDSTLARYDFKNSQNDFKSRGDMAVAKTMTCNKPKFHFTEPSRFLAEDFVSKLSSSYNAKERERQSQIAILEAKAKQQREKREEKEKLLSELLQEKLDLRQQLDEEEDEEELPELTEDMEDEIDDALAPGTNDIFAEEFNICINRQCTRTLECLNWLNDEVINFYIELIVKRSKENDDFLNVHAMNTFFYPKLKSQSYSSVRRWTKKVDVFSKDLILFPIHLGVHWCLAVADFKRKELRYYDSMGGCNHECLRLLRDWLSAEHKDKKKSPYDVSDWKLIVMNNGDIPQQMNGSDCGVFTCKFAEYIAAEKKINFSQDDMPYFRRAMVWEIINKSLLS